MIVYLPTLAFFHGGDAVGGSVSGDRGVWGDKGVGLVWEDEGGGQVWGNKGGAVK